MLIYAHIKYSECISPSYRLLKKKYLKEILSFTTWNAYGTCCQLAQKEGISIVLNKLMGPVINAAYGIGFQVAGYAGTLAYAITNAIRPQVVKAEGSGNRERALRLSNINSKSVFFLMSLICIPTIFEIKEILMLWLGKVPIYTDQFCIMVMLATMADSFTVGLTTINSAIGNIKKYTIFMNTPKILVFPISYVLLINGFSVLSLICIYVGVELLMAFCRIPLISKETGLNVSDFFINVILREIIPVLINIVICILCTSLFEFRYDFILTFIVSIFIYSISIYTLGLTHYERELIKNIVLNYIHR